MNRRSLRGFTIIEVLVILAVFLLGVLLLLPLFGRRHHRIHPQLKDSSQLRGIVQSLVVWANDNQDRYPLPSLIDADNATVAAAGAAKDTTANILSILIYNGFVPVEMCVSPAEISGSIEVDDNYEFADPATAVNPAKALWDPAFSADFRDGSIGNTSYAHHLPSSSRLAEWSMTFNQKHAVVGNRGPQITSVARTPTGVMPALANPNSNTMRIHGSRSKWEGNIAFNDNHVDFESGLHSEAVYLDVNGTEQLDFFHYDEPDDPAVTNIYLGIFTTAGEKPADFKAIWD